MACVPILIGCSTKIKEDPEDNPPRVCAKCHNPSVKKAKSKTWFEAFCIPIFPFTSTKIYRCQICGWEIKQSDGYEPAIAQAHPNQGQQHLHQSGYAPPAGMVYPPQAPANAAPPKH